MDVKTLKELTSNLTILYVEDNKNLQEETAKLFNHLFNQVDTAENGALGLEKFHKNHYDLIITDIEMPVMNGVELCRHIREEDSEISIIITSAHEESKYLIDLIDIGVDKFILKPLDLQKVLSVLFSICTNIVNKKLLESSQKFNNTRA